MKKKLLCYIRDLYKRIKRIEKNSIQNLQSVLEIGQEATIGVHLVHDKPVGNFLFASLTDRTNESFTKGNQFTVYAEPSGYINIYTGTQTNDLSSNDLSQIMYYGYRAAYGHTLENTTSSKAGTYIGRSAGYRAVGTKNTFLGHNSGYNIVDGNENTILGSYEFPSNTTLNKSIVISDGRSGIAGVGFKVAESGETTLPRQTISAYEADTTGKAAVTKEILEKILLEYVKE